jgi:hypothetical protein
VTLAELFAALGAALGSAFTDWAVWPHPPDATALPAVWPEYDTGHTAGGVLGQVAFKVVAAIAAQTSAAEYSRLFEAHDRLAAIGAAELGGGVGIVSRDDFVSTVTVGQTEHTALLYTFTLSIPLPC